MIFTKDQMIRLLKLERNDDLFDLHSYCNSFRMVESVESVCMDKTKDYINLIEGKIATFRLKQSRLEHFQSHALDEFNIDLTMDKDGNFYNGHTVNEKD